LQAGAHAIFADQCEDFFPLLKLGEERERFSLARYRSG